MFWAGCLLQKNLGCLPSCNESEPHSQDWLCHWRLCQRAVASSMRSAKGAQAGVPVLQEIFIGRSGCSLHFVSAASKLFLLLSLKGRTLGC